MSFKMYDVLKLSRYEKENLLGIVDPKVQTAQRLANARRDLEIKQADSDAEKLGYCLCGYNLTRLGKCAMYPEHTNGCINPNLSDAYVLSLKL